MKELIRNVSGTVLAEGNCTCIRRGRHPRKMPQSREGLLETGGIDEDAKRAPSKRKKAALHFRPKSRKGGNRLKKETPLA